MLARGVDAAGKGRIRDDPAATEQRQEIVLRTARSRFCTRWTSQSNTCGSTAIGLAPLTSVGIERVTGKKKLHLVVRTDDTASMNYQAHLHRKAT